MGASMSLKKQQAICLANTKLKLALNQSNTVFSNINAAKPVWWLDIANHKFNKDLSLLLNDEAQRILHYFYIPAGSIANPTNCFRQRIDKGSISHIEIYVTDNSYDDCLKKIISFKQYFQSRLTY
jgi:hypothetical protein